MGRTDARAGTGTEGFQSLLRAVGEGWCWAKLSGAHRLSRNAPDYPDARPFHEALVRANPERLVWGGDWPHPRVEGEMPDAGHLFELFQHGRRIEATQHRILVDQSRKALWLPELKVASAMSVNNKRVFYVKYLAHEIYADILQGAARRAARPAGERKSGRRLRRRSCRRRTPIRSARRAMNSQSISMSMRTCCGARRTS